MPFNANRKLNHLSFVIFDLQNVRLKGSGLRTIILFINTKEWCSKCFLSISTLFRVRNFIETERVGQVLNFFLFRTLCETKLSKGEILRR